MNDFRELGCNWGRITCNDGESLGSKDAGKHDININGKVELVVR